MWLVSEPWGSFPAEFYDATVRDSGRRAGHQESEFRLFSPTLRPQIQFLRISAPATNSFSSLSLSLCILPFIHHPFLGLSRIKLLCPPSSLCHRELTHSSKGELSAPQFPLHVKLILVPARSFLPNSWSGIPTWKGEMGPCMPGPG